MSKQTTVKERVLPYAHLPLKTGHILVNGYFGGWTLLTPNEFSKLNSRSFDSIPKLYKKLSKAGIIINEANTEEIISRYVSLNKNLFMRPCLHIINVTNTCTQRCTYCHAGVSRGKEKMNEETALKVVKFILENSNDSPTVEFQGGECLLDWPVVKLIIERLTELNKNIKKDLHITMVSNLSLLDEEKLDFLIEHNVSMCTSLDGPKEIHNFHRKFIDGSGSYDETIKKIKMIKEYQKKKGKLPFVGVLATISKNSLKYPKEIVDEYVKQGIEHIHIRPLNNLGDALESWNKLSYSAEEFIEFWEKVVKYIDELNKKGIEISERGLHIKLRKVLDQ